MSLPLLRRRLASLAEALAEAGPAAGTPDKAARAAASLAKLRAQAPSLRASLAARSQVRRQSSLDKAVCMDARNGGSACRLAVPAGLAGTHARAALSVPAGLYCLCMMQCLFTSNVCAHTLTHVAPAIAGGRRSGRRRRGGGAVFVRQPAAFHSIHT